MKKDFDRWNERKKEVNKREPNTEPHFYHEREVRWCSLGVNVGFEQDGTSALYMRPVLIIRGFSRNVCLIVPITTSTKINPYHISLEISVEGKELSAILSQIRLIDTKRLHERITIIGKEKFEEIRKTIRDLI